MKFRAILSVFSTVLMTTQVFCQDASGKVDLVKTSAEVAVKMASSQTNWLQTESRASFTATYDKWLHASMGLVADLGSQVVIDHAVIEAEAQDYQVAAGFELLELGLQSYLRADVQLAPERSAAQSNAVALGLAGRANAVSWKLPYRKNLQNVSASLALRPSADWSTVTALGTLAIHGKKDRLGGISLAGSLSENPQILGSIYFSENEQALRWSTEVAGSRISGPLGDIVGVSGDVSLGYRFEVASFELEPGVLVRSELGNLSRPGDYSVAIRGGAKTFLFKGATGWGWGGVKYASLPAALQPIWSFGMELSL